MLCAALLRLAAGSDEPRQCPEGYVPGSEIVFACGPQDGASRVAIARNVSGADVVISIPGGVKNADIAFAAAAGTALEASVLDPASGRTVARLGEGESAEAFWPSADDAAKVAVRMSRKNASALAVTLGGRLPGNLSLRLSLKPPVGDSSAAGASSRVDVVQATTRYDSFDGCGGGAVPAGCEVYDAAEARDSVYRWSAWVASEYPDAASAWSGLCEGALRAAGLAASDASGLPRFLWPVVWSQSPGARESSVPWQAAFRYIDALKSEDMSVSKDEFGAAYKLAAVGLSLFTWCTSLHEFHAKQAQAWKSVSDGKEEVDPSRWKDIVWPGFQPPDHFKKASAADSFAYLDSTNTGTISEKDFGSIWDLCGNNYQPDMTTPPLITTTTIERPPATSAAPSKPATSLRSSTAGPARLPGHKCCLELRAECLACQTGLTTADFCSRPTSERVPGCWTSSEAPGRGVCPYTGYAYTPPMPGVHPGVADNSGQCQAHCLSTPGCAFFSFWLLDGACVFHGVAATWAPAAGAISGPAVCVAEVTLRVPGVDFDGLSEKQQAVVRKGFARDLAKAAGVTIAGVSDLDGTVGSVSLYKGSLKVGSHVALPSNTTFLRFKASTPHLGLQERLAIRLAEANVSTPARTETIITMSVVALNRCILPGTVYAQRRVSEKDAAAELSFTESLVASSVADCRARCSKSDGCAWFTFWQEDGKCSLVDGAVVPAGDAGAIAGPRQCSPVPSEKDVGVASGSDASMDLAGAPELPGSIGELEHMPMWLLLNIVVCGVVALCSAVSLLVRLCTTSDRGGPKYRVLSRDEAEADEDEGVVRHFCPGDDISSQSVRTGNGSSLDVPAPAEEEGAGNGPSSVRRSLTPPCARAFLGPEALAHRQREIFAEKAAADDRSSADGR